MSTLKTNTIAPFSGTTVGIGTSSNQPGALLHAQSTSQGVAFPSMTTVQRNTIPAPFAGLLIFNTDTGHFEKYNGSSWESSEGIKSINGQISDAQIINVGSAGLTPNISQSGSNINTINIPLAATPSVTAGLISNGDYVSFDGRLYPTKNVVYVNKNTIVGPQGFNSIKDAIDSITTNSSTNQFLVIIGPGVYTEDTITLKSFVTVMAAGNGTVTVEPSNPNNDLFYVDGSNCRLQGVTIQNVTGSSAAGIHIVSAVAASIFDFITIVNCTTHIKAESDLLATQVVLRNIRFISGANSAIFCDIKSISGQPSIVRIYSLIGTEGSGALFQHGFKLSGAGSRLDSNTVLLRSTTNAGNGIYMEDGAELVVTSGMEVEAFDRNLFVANVGVAPIVRTSVIMLRQGVTDCLRIDHPGTTGSLIAKVDFAKTFVDENAPIKLDLRDPDPASTIGSFIRGDMLQADRFDRQLNLSKVIRNEATLGLLTGGDVDIDSGLDIEVTAGSGFIKDNVDFFMKEVSWNTTILTLPANSSTYVFINNSGVPTFSASVPSFETNIPLCRVVTDGSGVVFFDEAPLRMDHRPNSIELMLRDAIGPVYANGSIVTESVTDRQLNVTAGKFYFGTTIFLPSGGNDITFISHYQNGLGGWTRVPGQQVVDNGFFDDGTGTLAALTSGYYAKHSLYIVNDDVEETYLLVYAQAEYSSLILAEEADIPTPPPEFIDSVTLIASLIVQEGTTNLVEIRDERPTIGFKASGSSASADHGNLLGLLDDDHPQYLLANGTRAMTGPLDMGTNAIINVGLVDGVDVSGHAARHLPNGADPLATAAPAASLSATTTDSVGTANSLSRSDHGHAILTGVVSTQVPDQANAVGTSANLARADHIHNIPTAAPSVSLSATTTNTQGVGASFSRSDHGHAILTGIVATQLPNQANAAGVSANLARADHIHNIPTAAPVDIGTANAQGSAASFAQSDHVHAHGNQTSGTLHAAVTTSVNGFMTAADKVILDRHRTGFLQYNNGSLTTNNTITMADIVLDTDLNSFANGFFTKVSTTEFRADFNGRIKLHYSVAISQAGNNRGARVRVVKNGTLVPNTERPVMGSSVSSYSSTGHTQVVEVANGDLFKLQFATAVGGNVSTIAVGEASMMIEIFTLGLT